MGIVFAAGYLLSYLASTCVGWLTKKVSEVAWMYISGALIIASYVFTMIFDQSLVIFILAVLMIRAARLIRWPISSNLGNQYISTGSRATTEVSETVDRLFNEIQENLYQQAKANFDRNTHMAETLEALTDIIQTKRGFVLSGWCCNDRCEAKVKEDSGAVSRNIPFDPRKP